MVSNQSEIQNLIIILNQRFGILPSDVMFVLSIMFCAVIGFLAISTLNNKKQIFACMLIPITICTVLGFIPIIVYALICVALAFYLAKIIGGI